MSGPVITIARQIGSGGDEVAALVAERLGMPLLDRQIITRAARTAGVSEEALQSAERHSSLLTRMLENLSRFGTSGGPESLPPTDGISSIALMTTSADFRALLQQVLRDVAAAGPAVILGHAAQIALRDMPGTLHVFIHASADYRAARLARTENIPLEQARREVEDNDRERVRFYQTAYHVSWYDLRLYDLVLDTQLTGIEGAATAIVDLARACVEERPEPAPPSPAAPSPAAVVMEEAPTINIAGRDIRIRPMTPSDAGALLAFFRSLPPEDLLFLRRNVTDELTIDAWARDVADGRIITLLAEDAGTVVGEASLRPSDVPWTRHVGEVRVVIAPEMRGRGLGRALLQEIMEAARAAGVEKLTAEMTVEQAAARRLFERTGFVEEGRFRAYTRDQAGHPHDLLVMTHTSAEP
jgi:cytidylate kinase/L-amino acid N-acyltransferase YncA